MKKTTSTFAIGAMAAALTLTGCGIIEDQIGERVGEGVGDAIEGQLENAIESESGGEVDLDFGGDGADLPSSFPDSIPVPDGRIISSIGTADGWNISMQLDSADGLDAVAADLESQGYTLESEIDQPAMKIRTYVSDEYQVALGLISDDSGDEEFAMASIIVNPVESE